MKGYVVKHGNEYFVGTGFDVTNIQDAEIMSLGRAKDIAAELRAFQEDMRDGAIRPLRKKSKLKILQIESTIRILKEVSRENV